MSAIEVKAFAKVNLVLEVLGKRNDGYHEVSTILQEVPDLYDTIELSRASKTSLKCDNKEVITDESNSIIRVLKLMEEVLRVKLAYKISLQKKIPLLAGFGGSSSDTAAVLKAVDQDLGLGLTRSQMHGFLKQLSTDASFFLEGGIMLATGRGDKLSPLPKLPPCKIKTVDTGIRISTEEAYAELYLPFPRTAAKTAAVIEGLRELDIDKVTANLHNDFQEQAVKRHPEIQKAIDAELAAGASTCILTGTGGCVFAIV